MDKIVKTIKYTHVVESGDESHTKITYDFEYLFYKDFSSGPSDPNSTLFIDGVWNQDTCHDCERSGKTTETILIFTTVFSFLVLFLSVLYIFYASSKTWCCDFLKRTYWSPLLILEIRQWRKIRWLLTTSTLLTSALSFWSIIVFSKCYQSIYENNVEDYHAYGGEAFGCLICGISSVTISTTILLTVSVLNKIDYRRIEYKNSIRLIEDLLET